MVSVMVTFGRPKAHGRARPPVFCPSSSLAANAVLTWHAAYRSCTAAGMAATMGEHDRSSGGHCCTSFVCVRRRVDELVSDTR